MKFTYDGQGINDAQDEYKARVATLQPKYKTAEVGNVLAAAPVLLTALKAAQTVLAAYIAHEPVEMCAMAEAEDQARAAIAQATHDPYVSGDDVELDQATAAMYRANRKADDT